MSKTNEQKYTEAVKRERAAMYFVAANLIDTSGNNRESVMVFSIGKN